MRLTIFSILFVLLSCQLWSDGLAAGTLVTEIDSKMGAVQVPIEKVQPGDTLLVYSGEYGPISTASVVKTFKTNSKMILLKTSDGSLFLSRDHLVYLDNTGFVRADCLKIGDSPLRFDLKSAKFVSSVVTRISLITGDNYLYNLEVETWHNYLADGFVVHNKNETLLQLIQFWVIQLVWFSFICSGLLLSVSLLHFGFKEFMTILKNANLQKRKPFWFSVRRASTCLFSRRNGYVGKKFWGFSVCLRLFNKDLL